MKLKIHILLSTLILLISQYASSAPGSVSPQTLKSCYKDFPLLFQSLMLLTDKEFANKKQSQERKRVIKELYQKSPTELRECVRSINQFAEQEGDQDNIIYVKLRMKEFTGIVFQARSTGKAASTGVR